MHLKAYKSLMLLAVGLVVSLTSFGNVFAARPSGSTPVPVGNDIAWPQCGKTYPTGQAFGIVGVNGGLANNTNSCYASQLSWAQTSKGGTGQDKAALYVNTANPGLGGVNWPKDNMYDGKLIDNHYGSCDGTDTPTCAYIYGYAKAYDDYTIRGVINPSSYMWWLDVETSNSWENNTAANAADLEGMTAALQAMGARVGLYSTASQWDQIVGTTLPDSNLNGLQSWLAGASSLSSAQANCSLSPLTTNGSVALTQYISNRLDYNYSCIKL